METAARITEEKLLSVTSVIHSLLMTLMEIALKEERMDDAEYIADVDKQMTQLFDLWEYNSYVADFQLYYTSKNKVKSLNILLHMLKSLTKKWNINESPLYRHIQGKEVDRVLASKFQKAIIQSIIIDENGAFLKESPEFQKILEQMNIE